MNASREELEKKGYMEGKYVSGRNKAHNCCTPHTSIFGCRMYGTFNIWLKKGDILDFEPSIVTDAKSYWFVKIIKKGQVWYGWAIRDHTSKQGTRILEILTKERLPDILKEGRFGVVIIEKWSAEKIAEWSKDQYWFQGFPFATPIRSDSERVWNAINQIDWPGRTVLDIGAHTGYYAFKASEAGAQVIAMEPNNGSRTMGEVIRDNIVQQDVPFVKNVPEEKFDTILYLSVHHQPDPNYKILEQKIQELWRKAKSNLFIELIMPPMFPKNHSLTEEQIDKIVGGKILDRYKHEVRGFRKIYWKKR